MRSLAIAGVGLLHLFVETRRATSLSIRTMAGFAGFPLRVRHDGVE
jgi:hypothetical protein